MEFSAPLCKGSCHDYVTEGLLLRLVVVLFINPSVIFFENATSPCRGGELPVVRYNPSVS